MIELKHRYEHAQEYTAALVLIDMHAKLWGAA